MNVGFHISDAGSIPVPLANRADSLCFVGAGSLTG